MKNKCNSTENDENSREEVKDKPGEYQQAFLSSDTVNDHNAGEHAKEGDQNGDDEHGV